MRPLNRFNVQSLDIDAREIGVERYRIARLMYGDRDDVTIEARANNAIDRLLKAATAAGDDLDDANRFIETQVVKVVGEAMLTLAHLVDTETSRREETAKAALAARRSAAARRAAATRAAAKATPVAPTTKSEPAAKPKAATKAAKPAVKKPRREESASSTYRWDQADADHKKKKSWQADN